ncbi:RdgB/HAM1 family non-canonical purine NTP pyrophosphatase [Asticcacaulis sp. SL142]|uniref:RdgB/HAM1 family non-canonical purine NTP pyrophosphatase n=1 Tax=Asticcacaulis sp. SL142 TaxID=2995155 RepID=UPI00226CF772|nr:RdgB/HAM1 family non-canonical purine NTP pyrophosphatase [Asticcacaulis sp. SL142]WAC47111.1 RdgB/HAM1 family non-canonical purine NTP pyrophosphatase [Asticcacaulis sp. SL142]
MSLKLISGEELIAATHNPGKAKEISSLLGGRFVVISAKDANVPEPDETENSFIGNAILKARHAAMTAGIVALADDSGLSITALKGDPGIYSARWAGPDKDFRRAMEIIDHKLLQAQIHDAQFTTHAWFTCALAVAWPEGHAVVFEGRIDGDIVTPRGAGGFGYDPIFQPKGYGLTFAEMPEAQKDSISHRHLAFEQLKAALFD